MGRHLQWGREPTDGGHEDLAADSRQRRGRHGVGRTNKSEERTILVAKDGAEGGYGDYVLRVAIENDKVLRFVPQVVDAIQATRTVAEPTGASRSPAARHPRQAGHGLRGQRG
ncbi:hypothetical protein [Streptomyces sp. HUAS TT7]|uniref:hypothetical protein n=1 Tax=Streptomyces sp. HUAS TT7 TaxID=3447507 RepID=UPI003F65BCE6